MDEIAAHQPGGLLPVPSGGLLMALGDLP